MASSLMGMQWLGICSSSPVEYRGFMMEPKIFVAHNSDARTKNRLTQLEL